MYAEDADLISFLVCAVHDSVGVSERRRAICLALLVLRLRIDELLVLDDDMHHLKAGGLYPSS